MATTETTTTDAGDGTTQDPKAGAKPPFPPQQQEVPGNEAQLTPPADHGQESYRGSGRLQGLAALITGADSGIGRAVALAYAREGADVLISYLSEDEDARETARLVREAGRKAVLIPGDIGDEEHCRLLVERAVREFGRLDILVNNAAFQMTYEDIVEIPSADFDRTMKTNVYAMFWLCREALRHMQPGATIINTTSIQSYQPRGQLLPYATTKGAITTFTKGLAEAVAERGIRVNAVAPGPVWTPLIPSTMPPEKVAEFGANTPLGRPAQPAEIAPLYVFLASRESSYVTGAIYEITGGRPTA